MKKAISVLLLFSLLILNLPVEAFALQYNNLLASSSSESLNLSASKNICNVGEDIEFATSSGNFHSYKLTVYRNSINGPKVFEKDFLFGTVSWTPATPGTFVATCAGNNGNEMLTSQAVFIKVITKKNSTINVENSTYGFCLTAEMSNSNILAPNILSSITYDLAGVDWNAITISNKKAFGNLIYFQIVDSRTSIDSTNYLLVSLITGEIIYGASENFSVNPFEARAFKPATAPEALHQTATSLQLREYALCKEVSSFSPLAAIYHNGVYDIVNTETGELYPYGFSSFTYAGPKSTEGDLVFITPFSVDGTVIGIKGDIPNASYTLIASDGSPLLEDYQYISYWDPDYIEVRDRQSKTGIFTYDGQTVLPCQYRGIRDFDGKVAVVSGFDMISGGNTRYWYIVDRAGRTLCNTKSYIAISKLSNGVAIGCRPVYGHNEYLDQYGYFYSTCDLIYSDGTVVDLAARYGGKYASVQTYDKNALSPSLTSSKPFGSDFYNDFESSNIAVKVESYTIKNDGYGWPTNGDYSLHFEGYVDRQGQPIADLTGKYNALAFQSAFAIVTSKTNMKIQYLVNKRGDTLPLQLIGKCSYPKNNYIFVNDSAKTYGYMSYILNSYGEIVWGAQNEVSAQTTISSHIFLCDSSQPLTKWGDFSTDSGDFSGFVYKSVASGFADSAQGIITKELAVVQTADNFYAVINESGEKILMGLPSRPYITPAGNILAIVGERSNISIAGYGYSGYAMQYYEPNGTPLWPENTCYWESPRFTSVNDSLVHGIKVLTNQGFGYADLDGKTKVEPQFKKFYDLNNGYALCVTAGGGTCLVDLSNGQQLALADQEFYDSVKNGTIEFQIRYSTRAQVFRLESLKAHSLRLKMVNFVSSIGIGEEALIFASYQFGENMTYTGDAIWKSSNNAIIAVVDSPTQTGDLCASIRGLAPGRATISVELENGDTVSAEIAVAVTTENLLSQYPEYLKSSSFEKLMSEAQRTYSDILSLRSDRQDWVASYFTALKEGPQLIFGNAPVFKTIQDAFPGETITLESKYLLSATELLVEELNSNEQLCLEVMDDISDGWSNLKRGYDVSSKAGKERLKSDLATATDFEKEDIGKIITALEDSKILVDIIDYGITLSDIVVNIMCTKQLEVAVVEKLRGLQTSGSDLERGLYKLECTLKDNVYAAVVKTYFRDEVIKEIVNKCLAAGYDSVGIGSLASTLGKIAVKVIVEIYKGSGGVFADSIAETWYLSSFASRLYGQFSFAIMAYREQKNGQLHDLKVLTHSEFQLTYEAYVAATIAALESAAKIAGPQEAYLKKAALSYARELRLYNFDRYLQLCQKELSKDYLRHFDISEGAESATIIGYHVDAAQSKGVKIMSNSPLEYPLPLDECEVVVIPERVGELAVTAIGEDAFKNNTKIKSVILPDSITSIGKNAFYGCANLESVIMGDSVATIGESAFSNCKSLTQISVSKTLTSLGSYAFDNCVALQTIEFPSSLQSIPRQVLRGANQLKEVTIHGATTAISSDAFLGNTSIHFYGLPHSTSETFATNHGYTFGNLALPIIAIDVLTPPPETEVYQGRPVDFSGMVLQLTYADGTTTTVEKDWEVYGNTKKLGQAQALICYGTATTTYDIQVIPVPVEGITLEPIATNLFVGQTMLLICTPVPTDAICPKLYWKSSDKTVVTVTENSGFVTAVALGAARITATSEDGRYVAECDVTIEETKGVLISGQIQSDGTMHETTISLFSLDDIDQAVALHTTIIPPTISSENREQEFSIPDVMPGTYKMIVVKQGHLTVVRTIDVTDAELYVGTIQLLGGDINNDGYINGSDLSALLAVFGQSDASGGTDINGDTYINGTDLSILLKNFGASSK